MNKILFNQDKVQIEGKILKVPKQMIGEVSKLLKDQFGIILNEKSDSQYKEYKIEQRKNISLIANQMLNSFKTYCREKNYSVVEKELQKQLEKKRIHKVFTLYDLYELQYINQNRKEFLDKWETYLSLGYAKENLMNSKKIKNEIKLELKPILSQMLFECQKEDPKQSIYKHFIRNI